MRKINWPARAFLALLALSCAASAWAQSAPPILPDHTVYGRLGSGTGSGPGQAIPFAALSANLGGANLPQHPINSNYTLASTDCGSLIVDATAAFNSVSVSGTYPVNCVVHILNNDPIPTGMNSTGAKFVNFVNCNPSETGTYLWPQQTMDVVYVSSTWLPLRCPGLWELPTGAFTLNVDPTHGSDTWGAADGLALTSRAFASIANALNVSADTMQENFVRQTTFIAKLCSGCTDSQAVHWPSHGGSPLGAQGGDGTVVDCNGGTLSGGVQLFFQSTLGFQNCVFTSAVSATDNAVLVFATGGGANTLSGALLQITHGAQCRCDGATLNVTGSFSDMMQVTSGAITQLSINQTGNVTYSDAGILAAAGGYVTISAWTTNGFSATGTKYKLIECGILEGASLIAGSVSGSASCTQAN